MAVNQTIGKNFDLDKLDNEIMFSTRKLEAVDWHSLPTDHVPPEAKAKASSMAQAVQGITWVAL